MENSSRTVAIYMFFTHKHFYTYIYGFFANNKNFVVETYIVWVNKCCFMRFFDIQYLLFLVKLVNSTQKFMLKTGKISPI